jgi:head-tail adaptor
MFPAKTYKHIDPGAMREIVRIQTRTTSISSIGEPITASWADITDPLRFAGVVQNSSSEIAQAEGIVSSFGITFYMRYPLAGVEPGNCRIIYRDNIYHVAGIDRNTYRNHLVIVSCLRLDDAPTETIPPVTGQPGTGATTGIGEGPPLNQA